MKSEKAPSRLPKTLLPLMNIWLRMQGQSLDCHHEYRYGQRGAEGGSVFQIDAGEQNQRKAKCSSFF